MGSRSLMDCEEVMFLAADRYNPKSNPVVLRCDLLEHAPGEPHYDRGYRLHWLEEVN